MLKKLSMLAVASSVVLATGCASLSKEDQSSQIALLPARQKHKQPPPQRKHLPMLLHKKHLVPAQKRMQQWQKRKRLFRPLKQQWQKRKKQQKKQNVCFKKQAANKAEALYLLI
ncbi:hypothetical protein A3742_32675 [Oleiphilus sp. HI0071]|nr:hypothetical protein A3742_32675 [Oleiphilus sp. HI0071]